MKQINKIKLGALVVTSVISSTAYSAGFGLIEQSVTGLGRAFAGGGAVAGDASTIFYNPAGLTNLQQAELDIGLNFLAPKIEFTDSGSTSPFGVPLTGGDDGDVANNAFLPNLYYSTPLNDRVHLGIGVTAPFGLVTEYDDTWKGRFHAVKSDLRTININPTIAFKATDKVSVGFGVNLQKIDLELTQMADLGALGGAAFSQKADGKVNIEADDWSWGYNLGLMLQATESTRLGLAYRSKVSHTLKGNGTLRTATGALAADENIMGKVDLPESLSLAVHHQFNTRWAVMGEATWTRWSRFKELTIISDGTVLNSTKPENWNNVMRYSLGLDYQYDDQWTLRTGVAYDQSPIPEQFRTARLPGEDRFWFSLGASYKYSDKITVDAGYMHVFVRTADISEDDRSYVLNGKYDVSSDIFGLQMRWLLL
ncbi:MAG: outer membrane protein transport protein [Gammaproteobacteria bacterium]|nr:outer membrane protein transport protein [Gammaproteobacteria bacterium]